MRAEIISIGTEILLGSITNTNARYLADKLAQCAIDVFHQVTVGDNVSRILQCLEEAAVRSDILITSGGLGPTEDDVTLEAVARFLAVPRKRHAPSMRHIRRKLKEVKIPFTKLVQTQCFLPEGAGVFQNERGTAPGLLLSFFRGGQRKWLIVLPGPPRELIPLFESQILPDFFRRARYKRDFFTVRSVKITGLSESQVAERVTDLLKSPPPVTTGIYAKPGVVELKIMSKSSHSEASATKAAQKVEKIIRRRLGNRVFGVDGDSLSSAVGTLLNRQKKSLAVAESCTGGLLMNRLTDVAGSSDYFLGGVVAYANTAKMKLLGVDAKLLEKHGAVSARVAQAMASGVRDRFGSHFGIGITGIAGPGGGRGKKPVGLVYIALCDEKNAWVDGFNFRGGRLDVKSRAADKAMDLLRLRLLS